MARQFKSIYLRHFKPLYLIFDQFEELYILGSKDEQNQFVQTVREILRVKQPVKIILSIREEYLGHLYEFERAVPELLRKKLRVEPMNLDKVKTVIQSTGTRPDSLVRLHEGEGTAIAEGIFEKIRGEEKTLHIPLPYLQVFLDKLYLHVTGDKTRQSEAEFSLESLAGIGDLGDVLRNFLDEQVRDIAAELPATEERVWQMLSPFVTLEGTKEPLSENQLADKIPDAAPDLLRRALQAFVAHRILRFSESAQLYEIAHDSLAKQIHAKRSDEEIALLEVQRLVKSQTAMKAEAREYFSEKQLLFMEPYLGKYRLSAEEEAWVGESRKFAERQKEMAEERQKEELERAKLQAEQERRWRAEAEEQANLARKAITRAYANDISYKSHAALREGDRTTAYRLAEIASSYVDNTNLNVIRTLVDALYHNDNPDYHFLPWVTNLEGHFGSILSVAFSPDGKRLASGSDDNTVKLWDMESGKEIFTLKGHTSWVMSVAFSPDGKRLATGSSDGTTKIWDIESGKDLLTLETDKGLFRNRVLSVTFSPDSKRLAAGFSTNIAKIWDLESGKEDFTLTGHTNWIMSVVFSPDGKLLATGSSDKKIKIWDFKNETEVSTLELDYKCMSIAFSPDGKLLATGSSDNIGRIWDWRSGRICYLLQGHIGSIMSIGFSLDGKQLITASSDKTSRIWDSESGKEILLLKGHTNWVMSAAFSPNGKRLATGSSDNTVKIWSLDRDKEALTLEASKDIIHDSVMSIAFSPDGKRLATGYLDNNAEVWNLESGKKSLILQGHKFSVKSIAFSPDGNLLATGSADKAVKIWDLRNGKEIYALKGHEHGVLSIIFSLDGRYLVTGAEDNMAKIWDLEKREEILALRGHTGSVMSVAFSPNRKYLATGSSDITVKLWDIESGNELFTLQGHIGSVTSVAFSPNGKLLATGSSDNTAKLWDVESRKEFLTLKGHTDKVLSVAFSPNGNCLVTGSYDNTIKIWDIDSGKESFTLHGHIGGVMCCAFSPDGQYIATGSSDGTAKIWALFPEATRVHSNSNNVSQLPLAHLTFPQLTTYNLENLLDQKPDNEEKLIATNETWQIAAFADLYADKIAKSLPRRADYERAQRLYAACLRSGVEEKYFKEKVAELERVWKERGE